MLKRFISTSVLVVLVSAMASGANAFTSDKRTYFTFSQPVALPGVTLPAGTYTFRLADDTTTRKVIQVANREGNQSYAMLLTMPAYRMDTPADPEIRFMETASGAPVAVKAWWQAGERIGYEFLYSKEQLAALNRTAAADSAGEALEREVAVERDRGEPVDSPGVIDGPGVPPAVETETEIEAETEVEAEAEVQAQAQPAAQAPAEDVRTETRERLPQTASPLPLLLLGGIASASIGLRLLRRS